MSIDARTDWENRIGTRSGAWEGDFRGDAPELDPPTGLAADAGAAQVTLTWDPVPGAIGYQLHVSGSADGIVEPLDHHGRDVTSVPHPQARPLLRLRLRPARGLRPDDGARVGAVRPRARPARAAQRPRGHGVRRRPGPAAR